MFPQCKGHILPHVVHNNGIQLRQERQPGSLEHRIVFLLPCHSYQEKSEIIMEATCSGYHMAMMTWCICCSNPGQKQPKENTAIGLQPRSPVVTGSMNKVPWGLSTSAVSSLDEW